MAFCDPHKGEALSPGLAKPERRVFSLKGNPALGFLIAVFFQMLRLML
jgi:hypothetical protein